MNELLQNVTNNLTFVLEFAALIVGLFLISLALEKLVRKKQNRTGKIFTTRVMAVVGMFSALSAILMLFEIPVPFAPSFYKLDFSELPILVGTFAFGPAAGVMMEFMKILLKLVIKGTSTAFVGELANFCVGCSLIIPASAVYLYLKTKKGAIEACITGTLVMTIFGTAFNAIYLLPAFAALFGMPMEVILSMGSAIYPNLDMNVVTFVCVCVAPLNLLKGTLVSVITMFIYKPLSPIIKSNQ